MLQLNIINRQPTLSVTFDQMLSRNGKEVCLLDLLVKLIPKWGRYDELIATKINGFFILCSSQEVTSKLLQFLNIYLCSF